MKLLSQIIVPPSSMTDQILELLKEPPNWVIVPVPQVMRMSLEQNESEHTRPGILIGSSEERHMIKADQDNAYLASLRNDRATEDVERKALERGNGMSEERVSSVHLWSWSSKRANFLVRWFRFVIQPWDY